MPSLKEILICHFICYLTQAAMTGCIFLAASLLNIDSFAAVAHCHILMGISFTLCNPYTS